MILVQRVHIMNAAQQNTGKRRRLQPVHPLLCQHFFKRWMVFAATPRKKHPGRKCKKQTDSKSVHDQVIRLASKYPAPIDLPEQNCRAHSNQRSGCHPVDKAPCDFIVEFWLFRTQIYRSKDKSCRYNAQHCLENRHHCRRRLVGVDQTHDNILCLHLSRSAVCEDIIAAKAGQPRFPCIFIRKLQRLRLTLQLPDISRPPRRIDSQRNPHKAGHFVRFEFKIPVNQHFVIFIVNEQMIILPGRFWRCHIQLQITQIIALCNQHLLNLLILPHLHGSHGIFCTRQKPVFFQQFSRSQQKKNRCQIKQNDINNCLICFNLSIHEKPFRKGNHPADFRQPVFLLLRRISHFSHYL